MDKDPQSFLHIFKMQKPWCKNEVHEMCGRIILGDGALGNCILIGTGGWTGDGLNAGVGCITMKFVTCIKDKIVISIIFTPFTYNNA